MLFDFKVQVVVKMGGREEGCIEDEGDSFVNGHGAKNRAKERGRSSEEIH
jgi:hypothetical protein